MSIDTSTLGTIKPETIKPETFALEIGRLHRDVPLVRPTPNTRLPLIELLGDAELTRTCALELQKILPANSEVIFTCETSSIVLAHALSELTGLPYEVARKRRRPYMDAPLIQEVNAMTLGVGETLWLASSHAKRLAGKQVVVILDVVSSGGTIAALERLVVRAGGSVTGRLAVFSQGSPKDGIVAVKELPVG
jgi:adenine phosphoribosyltransferase